MVNKPRGLALSNRLTALQIQVNVLLASRANRYIIIGAENAADYDFGPTPSATADFGRLTGLSIGEDETLGGPLLILEA